MKLEISNRRKLKNSQMHGNWATCSDYKYIKEEVTREIRKFFDMNENKNTAFQNSWYAAETVVRGKSIALNVYIF